MNFKFEVEGRILRKTESSNHKKNDPNNLFCSFVFTTSDWKHLEKYAVFWNRKGKSTIRYIGKGMKEVCELPEMVLNDLFFYVQVYANDEILTQKLKVFTLKNIENQKENHNEKINQFFKEMENKIDNIVYDNGKFLVYANNKKINEFNIVDENLISQIITGVAPQFVVDTAISEDSDLPVSSKLVFQALQNKVDIDSLSAIALTGDFNDLQNIPSKFPPEAHTHEKDDIEDWNESIEQDFDDFIDNLILKL